MPDREDFATFLRRIRAGDQQAATELYQRFGPIIRREVRLRLANTALRRLLDSMDVCQSVLASFFLRATADEYELNGPQDLIKLLAKMARNKFDFQARKHLARKRDVRQQSSTSVEEVNPVRRGPSPSQVIAAQELLGEVRQRLSDEERDLAERRAAGQEWVAIAAEVGGTPDGLRMRLARALDRVEQQLGLREADDE
jgi:RNA polymerase sigma-70 factor (ECF subfamily)